MLTFLLNRNLGGSLSHDSLSQNMVCVKSPHCESLAITPMLFTDQVPALTPPDVWSSIYPTLVYTPRSCAQMWLGHALLLPGVGLHGTQSED